MEYEVIRSNDLEQLIVWVNVRLCNGWLLHGGVQVESRTHSSLNISDVFYLQTMIKEEET